MFIATIATLLTLGNAQLEVEIADTESARNQGLMNRESLEENQGMLFIYPEPQILSFWMKNTLIPLSIGFFSKAKVLVQIEDMDPPTSSNLRLYKSTKKAMYALEVPQGWFKRNKISLGEKFVLQDNHPFGENQ